MKTEEKNRFDRNGELIRRYRAGQRDAGEELCELNEAIDRQKQEEIEEEMGDLLLTVTSLCRKLGVEPESALNKATDKFIDRFSVLEQAVICQKKNINDMTMAELDAVWEEIKHKKL